MTDFKELKQRLNLEEVFNYYGLFPSEEDGFIQCPFHKDSTPSLHYNFQKNVFYCHGKGCGCNGDILNFIQNIKRCSDHESGIIAEKILKARIKIDTKIIKTKKQKRVSRKKSKPSYSPITAERYKEILGAILELSPLPKYICKKYLFSKKQFDFQIYVYNKELNRNIKKQYSYKSPNFSQKIVKKFKIGFIKSQYADLRNKLLEKGFSSAELVATGIFKINKAGRVFMPKHWTGRIIYPFLKNEKVISLIGRQTEYSQSSCKYACCKSHNLVNASKIFNVDIIKKHKNILIAEGVTDCIKANKFMPSISPVATNFTNASYAYLAKLLKDKNVLICFDSEVNNSGINGAKRTQESLGQFGVDSKIIILPRNNKEKVDLCDFLNEYSFSDFDKLRKF